jgi:hypothetical protein
VLDESRLVESEQNKRHPKSLRLRMSEKHALMENTDKVAEIQNTLKAETTMSLSSVEIVAV